MTSAHTALHPLTPIPAAIYARVSKEEKEDQPGFSLPGQIHACLRYAETYSLQVEPEHIFQDDFTGKAASRPGLDALQEVLASRRIQALIVANIDRLGRSHYDKVQLFRELERHGVTLCHLGTAPGQKSRDHQLLINLLSLFSDFEHSIILERMERGRRARASAGYPRKQKVPFGYRWVEELLPDGSTYQQAREKRHSRGTYAIEPEEAAIVLKIFHWYTAKGWPAYRIAQELNRLGVPTMRDQRGYARRQHAVAGWCRSSVQHILSNQDYLGTQVYGKRTVVARKANGKPARMGLTPEESWIPVRIPALITPAVFQRAQEQAASNKNLYAKRRKYTHLFGAGRVTCGVCKLHMGGALNHGRVYYRCNAQQGSPHVCRRQFSGRLLEEVVWREIQARFSDPSVALALFCQETPGEHQPRTKALQAHREGLEKQQRQLSLKLQRLEDAYYDGTETREEYAEKKKRFLKEKDLVQTQLLALQAQQQQGQALTEHRADMEQVLATIARDLEQMETLEDKLDLLAILRLTVEYMPDKQFKIRVQPFAQLGANVAVVTTLHKQSGHYSDVMTWTCVA